MSLLVQNVIVSIVALAALAIAGWRLIGGRRRRSGATPGCASCESGGEPCAPAKPSGAEPDVHPLTVIRSKPH